MLFSSRRLTREPEGMDMVTVAARSRPGQQLMFMTRPHDASALTEGGAGEISAGLYLGELHGLPPRRVTLYACSPYQCQASTLMGSGMSEAPSMSGRQIPEGLRIIRILHSISPTGCLGRRNLESYWPFISDDCFIAFLLKRKRNRWEKIRMGGT